MVEFDLQVSTGKVELQQTNEGSREELVVSANLHIANCENLNVTAHIFGHNASISAQLSTDPDLAEIYGDKLFEDKSFALIYAHNETRSMDRMFKIGRRQPNDTLLKSEKVLVNSEFSNFPQYEIEYNGPNTFITQMDFQFNVSNFIYSGLQMRIPFLMWNDNAELLQFEITVAINRLCSFHLLQSPTATAFLNSSFIEAQSFNAMVYDLSRSEFTVKYNVYGYNANDKPSHYKSILTF